jgi:hypothetical protein
MKHHVMMEICWSPHKSTEGQKSRETVPLKAMIEIRTVSSRGDLEGGGGAGLIELSIKKF